MSELEICSVCGAHYEYRDGRWVCPSCGSHKSTDASTLSSEEVKTTQDKKTTKILFIITAIIIFVMLITMLIIKSSPSSKFEYTKYWHNDHVTIQGIKNEGYAINNGSVEIPSTINGMPVGLGSRVFEGNSFTTLILPQNLQEIFSDSLDGCSGLKNIVYKGTISDWKKLDGSENIDISKYNFTHEGSCECTEWSVNSNYDCEVGGTKTRNCLYCEKVYSETIAPAEHQSTIIPSVEPTCSSLGKTEGSICLVCNKVFTAQMDIPKLSHTVVIDSAVSPTCSKTGLTEGSHCSSCGAILTSQKEISPKGHTLVNRTCSICGFVQISEGLKYVTYGNGVAVSGIGTCTDTEIIIPNIYDGKTVLGISDFAFRDNTQITKITFPNTLTFIGKFAFDGCSSIKSITIPDTVTSIGSYAFSDCNQLEEITLPFVGNSATGEGATSNYDKNFGFIFGSGANEYVPDSLKKVTITKGRIASSSFRGCSSIETIILPEGLQEIGERTFQSCTSLVNIVIPNSVTYIGDYAFSGCNKLQTITIPSNILDIGTWAFNACGALETIYFEATSMNDLDSEKSIFHSAGKSGNGIKVIVASNVTKIPNYLFYSSYTPEAPNLKSVEFEENSVCYMIGDYAFAYCTNLSYVVLPNTLTDIGVRAFYGSENLKEITIPISVARISEYAFNWYKGPTIYCEAASKPNGWDDLWADYNFGDTIIWGYTE